MRRRRRGRGFEYLDQGGRSISDRDTLERARELAIPPAWERVWICPDPMGHLQATGVDAAGRKQYLYHRRWRERRDEQKFNRMIQFATAMPRLRRRVGADLGGTEPVRTRVLACAVRLLDVGLFRVGSEEYADQGGGLGLTTIDKEHVAIENGAALFDYPAKGGVRRVQAVTDEASVEVVRTLRRRRSGGEQLLAYREGRSWIPVRAADVNAYLKERVGEEFSAKDFRTWNATVLAAAALAAPGAQARTKSARQRAIRAAVRDVAEVLGNTPAVARRAYIDPRVFDRYLSGSTIAGAVQGLRPLEHPDDRDRHKLERAVLDLLADDHSSAAVTQIAAA